jgi:hypothetical protein
MLLRGQSKRQGAKMGALTGPLGLTMTLGGRWWPALLTPPTAAPPVVGFSCCDCRNCGAGLSELGRPSCGAGRCGGGGTLSLLGSGLLRSTRPPCALETRAVCEEVGVAWVEFAGEWVAEPWGDAEPEADGSPFFFEDLLESLPLESCCCLLCQRERAGGRCE